MKRFYCIAVVAAGVAWGAVAQPAYAATITFDPQEERVGTNQPFLVGVDLSAERAINVVSVALQFSPGLRPVDVSDGNSILSFWVEQPAFDEATGVLRFAGLVPGGFSGSKARLLVLSVEASGAGPATVSVLPESRVYLHAVTPTQDTLVAEPLELIRDTSRNNLANELPDTFAPESFEPALMRLPPEAGSAWAVVFATQDKGSGVARFEVREAGLFSWWAPWREAESPYVLTDQNLSSLIEIRAYDKKGNVREERVAASVTPKPYAALISTLLLLCIAAAYAWVRLRRY